MHLIIDGYNGDKQKLQDLELVRNILDEYPSKIGMKKIMSPYVLTHKDSKVENCGISGFVIIAESHISIHTFPERNCINVDIFSCKNFETTQAVEYIQEKFELKKVETKIINRMVEI